MDWGKNEYFNCSSPSVEHCGVPFSCCINVTDISVNSFFFQILSMKNYIETCLHTFNIIIYRENSPIKCADTKTRS